MNRSPLVRQIPVNSPENERQACFPRDTLDSRRRTRIFQRTVEEGGSREEKRDATEKEKKKEPAYAKWAKPSTLSRFLLSIIHDRAHRFF